MGGRLHCNVHSEPNTQLPSVATLSSAWCPGVLLTPSKPRPPQLAAAVGHHGSMMRPGAPFSPVTSWHELQSPLVWGVTIESVLPP